MARPRVLLLRSSRTSPDPYVEALARAGFEAACVPVLRFEAVGREALAAALGAPEAWGGLVLTSPRAVDALAGADLTPWHAKPAFAVGPATADGARALGLEPEGEGAGSAEALADLVTRRSFERPLLFLCGDRRRDVLPDRLRAAGIPFQERVVYRTLGDADGLAEAVDAEPAWVVFFSPSGVEAVVDLAGPSWNRARKAAIGATTADALRAAGCPPAAVAASPTPSSLAAALLHAPRSPDA